MYLVAECSTRSAPCSSGRQITGGASVESTTSSAPASAAIPARAGRSATAVVGLASVSPYMTRVAGRSAARTCVQVGQVHEVGLHAESRRHVAQEAVAAAVGGRSGDHVRARAGEREEDPADGSHPGRERLGCWPGRAG